MYIAGNNKVTSTASSQDQTYCPKNYLMSGGFRAAAKDRDDQLLQLNRAAIKACVHNSTKGNLCVLSQH